MLFNLKALSASLVAFKQWLKEPIKDPAEIEKNAVKPPPPRLKNILN